MIPRTRALLLLAAVAVLTAAPPIHARQATEESARRLYESGMAFLQQRKFAEALKDFDGVVTSFPTSAVAPDALLQVSTYQLEIARDPANARTIADSLIKKYPQSEAAPMAYVLSGRSMLAAGRTPDELDTALATFERVPRL